MKLLYLFLVAATLYPQAFPSRIPTDRDLLVAADRAASKLSAGINDSTLSIPVDSAASFDVPSIITIENEKIKICSKSGSTLVACSDGRGYGSTNAAAHSSQRDVRQQITEDYHNGLKAEVKELAKQVADNRAYDFAAISGVDFTGLLATSPGAQTITFSAPFECPLGVAGANTGHPLRLTNSVTSEVVEITGGSCTSGGTGTLEFTSTQIYLGGTVTLNSATAGIQEYIASLGASGGEVRIARGGQTIYAPVVVSGSYVKVRGIGGGSVILPSGFSTEHVFLFQGSGAQSFNEISDLRIECSAAQTSGYAIVADTQNYFKGERITTGNCPSGALLNEANSSQLADVVVFEIESGTGVAVQVQGASTLALRLDRIVTNTGTGTPLAGIRLRQSGDVIIRDSHLMRSGFGMLIDPGEGQAVSSVDVWGTYFDNDQYDAVRIAPTSTGWVARVRFDTSWFSSAGANGFHATATLPAVIDGVNIDNAHVFLNANYGLFAEGTGTKNLRVNGSVLSQNSLGSSGTYAGALFAISQFSFTNNKSGASDGLSATHSYGVQVYPGDFDHYSVTGNDLSGNVVTGISEGGTGKDKLILDNRGADPTTENTDLRSSRFEFVLRNGTEVTGDLSTAGAKTVTIASGHNWPFGVSGANSNHYLRISGGTGTAETVLITGGTAVSGAGTGTLEFTTANTHTGAWTITSATVGMQELVNATPNGAEVKIPAGSVTTYGPVTFTAGHRFAGAGKEKTAITAANDSLPAFRYRSEVLASAYDINAAIRFSGMTINAKNAISLNEYPAPTWQATLLQVRIDDVRLRGTYDSQTDADRWTASVPSLSTMRGFGIGVDCVQCFETYITGSMIQGFGIGVYLAGDENVIDGGNRLSFNGWNVYLDGDTAWGEINANKILNSVVSANQRVGGITQHKAHHTLISGNYQENYCNSAQFVRSTAGIGLMYTNNRIDDPANSGLASAMGCGAVTTTTPILHLDDYNSDLVANNNMNIGVGAVPAMSFGTTYWNASRQNPYRVINNNEFWPTPTGMLNPNTGTTFATYPGVLVAPLNPYVAKHNNVPGSVIFGASAASFGSTWQQSSVTGRWALGTGTDYAFTFYLPEARAASYKVRFVARRVGAGTAPVTIQYVGTGTTTLHSSNLALTSTTEVEIKDVTVSVPGGENMRGRLVVSVDGSTAEYEQIEVIPQ